MEGRHDHHHQHKDHNSCSDRTKNRTWIFDLYKTESATTILNHTNAKSQQLSTVHMLHIALYNISKKKLQSNFTTPSHKHQITSPRIQVLHTQPLLLVKRKCFLIRQRIVVLCGWKFWLVQQRNKYIDIRFAGFDI